MSSQTKKLAWSLVIPTLLACSKETKPVAEDAKAPTAASTSEADAKRLEAESENAKPTPAKGDESAALAGPAAPGKDSVSETSFDLRIQPKGDYQVGQSGSVEIVLDAKQPFHINKDYPYSFALKPSEGMSFPSMKVRKDAVALQEKQAVMKVGFTPEAAGERTISGTFKFSVCTEEQCLIKKHDLELAVNVQ